MPINELEAYQYHYYTIEENYNNYSEKNTQS